MQGYNVIAVFNENADKMLMCKRRKNPYKGLSNLVGVQSQRKSWAFLGSEPRRWPCEDT